MSRVRFHGVTVKCQGYDVWDTMPAEPCQQTLTVAGSDRPEEHGWGIVAVYDGLYDSQTIGDQNGWNNYDLCPKHYREQMEFLGIGKGDIPTPPPDVVPHGGDHAVLIEDNK